MRCTRSFFSVALKDSAHALSQHTPVRPTYGRIPYFFKWSANCWEVYCDPRSDLFQR